MTYLRELWRRGPVHEYFAGLEPIDRATFWIAVALALAVGLSFSVIVHAREASVTSAPRLTAPPFTLQFAAASP